MHRKGNESIPDCVATWRLRSTHRIPATADRGRERDEELRVLRWGEVKSLRHMMVRDFSVTEGYGVVWLEMVADTCFERRRVEKESIVREWINAKVVTLFREVWTGSKSRPNQTNLFLIILATLTPAPSTPTKYVFVDFIHIFLLIKRYYYLWETKLDWCMKKMETIKAI